LCYLYDYSDGWYLFGHKNSRRRHGHPVVVVVCFLLTGGEPPTQSRLNFQSKELGKAKLIKLLRPFLTKTETVFVLDPKQKPKKMLSSWLMTDTGSVKNGTFLLSEN
jgi:hypothetical protein